MAGFRGFRTRLCPGMSPEVGALPDKWPRLSKFVLSACAASVAELGIASVCPCLSSCDYKSQHALLACWYLWYHCSLLQYIALWGRICMGFIVLQVSNILCIPIPHCPMLRLLSVNGSIGRFSP